MAVQEGYTQVAPDSTGDKIRTIEKDVVQPDASTATVAMQTVTVADDAGNVISPAKDGTDITTPTAMPAGGVGIRGWLSAIWTKLNETIGVTGTFWQTTQPVSISSMPSTPVTNANLDAKLSDIKAKTDNLDVLLSTRLKGADTLTKVSTLDTITNAVPVTGTFWPTTQPVSGPLTDTQLRATAVPITIDSTETSIANEDTRQLLSDILKELKIINIHLNSITGEKISNMEVI